MQHDGRAQMQMQRQECAVENVSLSALSASCVPIAMLQQSCAEVVHDVPRAWCIRAAAAQLISFCGVRNAHSDDPALTENMYANVICD